MSLLTGKTGLIIGVANKHSIAWAIAQSAAGQGAQLLFNYQNERLRENVEELVATMPGAKAFPCDVGDDAQIAALMQSVGKETAKLDFLVHSSRIRAARRTHGAVREYYAARICHGTRRERLFARGRDQSRPAVDDRRRIRRYPHLPRSGTGRAPLQRHGGCQSRARSNRPLSRPRPRPQEHPGECHIRRPD